MKKLTMFFLLALLMFTMLFQTGCSSDSTTDDADIIVVGVEVTYPTTDDILRVGLDFTVLGQLSGKTSNYRQINFYIENNLVESWSEAKLDTLAGLMAYDATFDQGINTIDLPINIEVGVSYSLRVEVVGTNSATDDVEIQIQFELPGDDDAWIDFEILGPDTTEYAIGDIIEFEVELLGNQTIFQFFAGYMGEEMDPFYLVSTFDDTLRFNYNTFDLAVGDYSVRLHIRDNDNGVKEKTYSFRLIEDITQFEITDDAGLGYELKSVVQTYDGGYVTVASDSILGTRLVKYDYNKDTESPYVVWTENIAPEVGIAESICEDRDYNGGIVMAGWRINSVDGLKDTWVRKVSSEDGSSIWNKHFGYGGIDDGATVIKKSKDDGYIIGGYTYNYYHADIFDGGYEEFAIPFPNENGVDSVVYNWDTGYDIRLLKIYSNGNENWGHHNIKMGHIAWHDISSHIYFDPIATSVTGWWVRTMGDQYITDITVDEQYGYYAITGWNNNRLYDGGLGRNAKKDVFYAYTDENGAFFGTMTWSRMSAVDIECRNGQHSNFYKYFADDFDTSRLNYWSTLNASSLGSPNEDEIGYGIAITHEVYGPYGGNRVIVGETYQIDDTKSKLHDAWVMEFLISHADDDDGALWEYSFGAEEVDDKAFGVDRTKDEGYIVTGYTTGSDNYKQTWTYKLNTELLLVWSQKYDTAGDDWGVKVLQTRDGGYITGGNVGTGAGIKGRLLKVNKLGELEE